MKDGEIIDPSHAVLESLNEVYAVRDSTRPSPNFFFRFVPEKLSTSLTLGKIN